MLFILLLCIKILNNAIVSYILVAVLYTCAHFGKLEDKFCALSCGTVNPHGAAMEKHAVLHNGKAQARALDALMPAVVHPIETLENMG